jgi:RimJ/RimL family protein N-acetyltransferase
LRITTDRLLLREFGPDDFEGYAAMCADPEVMQYLSPDGAVLSRDDAWRQMAVFAGHWVLRGYGMWVVEERASGRFVGRVGLHYPEGWPGQEVGWALARQFWGLGLAEEAARAAIQYAFERLGWREVISLIHPKNQRSISLALRLGERLERTVEVRGLSHNLYRLVRGA